MKPQPWIHFLIVLGTFLVAGLNTSYAHDSKAFSILLSNAEQADPIRRLVGRIRLVAALASDPAAAELFLQSVQSHTLSPDLEILLSKYGHVLSPEAQSLLDKFNARSPLGLQKPKLPIVPIQPGTMPEQLHALLKNGDPATRWAATQLAAEASLIHPDFQKVLLESLGDSSPEIQKLGILHLQRLANIYKNGPTAKEESAMESISQHLSELLKSSRPEVRSAAARVLGRQADSVAYQLELIQALAKEVDPSSRLDLILAIKDVCLIGKTAPHTQLGELILQPWVAPAVKNEAIQIYWSFPKNTSITPTPYDLFVLETLKGDRNKDIAKAAARGFDFLKKSYPQIVPKGLPPADLLPPGTPTSNLQKLKATLLSRVCKIAEPEFKPRF